MTDDPSARAETQPPEPLLEPPPTVSPRAWGAAASLGLTVGLMLLYTLLQLVVLSGLMGGWSTLSGQPRAAAAGSLGLLASLSLLVAGPLVTLAVVGLCRRRGSVKAYLGLVRPRMGPALAWTAAVALFLWGYDVVGTYLGRPAVPEFMLGFYRTAVSLPLLYLAVAGVVPVLEELLFRGFLLPGLAASRLGRWGAVVVSSALWACLHFQYDLYDISGIFLLGLAFGAMRLRHGSTLLPLALHAAVNAFALVQVGWYLGA